jgi:hypothetical protein
MNTEGLTSERKLLSTPKANSSHQGKMGKVSFSSGESVDEDEYEDNISFRHLKEQVI